MLAGHRLCTVDRNARAGAWTLRPPSCARMPVPGPAIAMPAQGLGRCDSRANARSLLGDTIAMPAQGLGRCDYRSRLLRTRAVRIAMPAQGLGRCDTRIYEKGGHVPDHRNARAGAWTLRQPDVRIRAPRIVASQCPRRGLDAATRPHAHRRPSSRHRNARAGAWTLRLRKSHRGSQEGPRRYRNARAGAWTLRQHVPEDGKPAVGGIAMPAQGLGRCDLRKTMRTLPPGCYRNARAGAWTLRPMGVHARDPELPGIAKMRQPALSSKLEMTGSPHNPLLSLPLASLSSHPPSSCQP